MKNSTYKYTSTLTDSDNLYEVKDYTSIYYGGLEELFKQYSDYFDTYELSMDQKIEEVSYELYKSVDYSDLILSINSDVFLWGMFYNEDIIIEKTNIIETYIRNNINRNIVDLDKKIEEIAESISDYNNRSKIILVPKETKLNTVLKLVSEYRKNNTVKVID